MDPELRELHADFGAVMARIQLIELVLLALVSAQEEDTETRATGEGTQRLEELFSLTAGQLRRRAKIADGDLANLVEDAITLRNQLVHGWLMRSAREVGKGASTMASERAQLVSAERAFQRVQIDLEAILRETIEKPDMELLMTLMDSRVGTGSMPPLR